MLCEMCGKETGSVKKINVEGSLLSVCPTCAKFGMEPQVQAKTESRQQKEVFASTTSIEDRLAHRQRRMHSKNIFSESSSSELIEDYHKVIQKVRVELGMNQEELARKLNERKSIIAKLENKSIKPDNKLIRKLEKTLKISLLENVE